MISTSWKCLLLWQISILGGAYEQEGTGEKRGGGGGSFFLGGGGFLTGLARIDVGACYTYIIAICTWY